MTEHMRDHADKYAYSRTERIGFLILLCFVVGMGAAVTLAVVQLLK